MIPKIIHWCWLSNDPIPESLQKCMDSWRVYLPDYEFIHWNFERFPRGKSKWVDEAFDNKKFAFAADYIRLYALYNYGGIYLDMDVEVCKSFDPFLNLHSMVCWQNGVDAGLEVAAFGVEKNSKWIKDCLDLYDGRSFVQDDGTLDTTTLPMRIDRNLRRLRYNLVTVATIEEALKVESCDTIPLFMYDFFSPKSYGTGKIQRTDRTVCIHHFAGTWLPWYCLLEKKICGILGIRYRDYLHRHFCK